MSVESICPEILSSVPKAVAAGVIDMGTGMLLDVKTTDSHPSSVLDMLAAATRDLFEGQMVTEIETHFKRARGEEDKPYHYFKEIIVNSENLVHIFTRLPAEPSVVICSVCRISGNLGLMLTKMRSIANKATV